MEKCKKCDSESESINRTIDGNVCYHCLKNSYTQCYRCGNYVNNEHIGIVQYDGNRNHICNCCMEGLYLCEDCDEYVTELISINDSTGVCVYCFQNYYYCDKCNTYYFDDDCNCPKEDNK